MAQLVPRRQLPNTKEHCAENSAPVSVEVIRTLGNGRAARAELVDATMPNGAVVRCVEKVFQPGRLTRVIYRLGFQSPFAYQTNRNAILAAFFRRRVAAKVLAHAGTDVSVAEPLYVRYDDASKAWVLAANWIQGRGVRPQPAHAKRIEKLLRVHSDHDSETTSPRAGEAEIDQLVRTMRTVEDAFVQTGLFGSGWQVSPRALVSTANLLRVGDKYTVIDLESGIPAILDPRYLLLSLRRGAIPPFDDLDAADLQDWFKANENNLMLKHGITATETLQSDIESLIQHSKAWKESEVSVLRRPWRLTKTATWNQYQTQTFDHWLRQGWVDPAKHAVLAGRPFYAAAIWWASLLPGRFGNAAARLVGRQESRLNLKRFFSDRDYRSKRLDRYRANSRAKLIQAGRLGERAKPKGIRLAVHQLLAKTTPAKVHSVLTNGVVFKNTCRKSRLLFLNRDYRERIGRRRITKSIERWKDAQRISGRHADELRRDLSDKEICTYMQGFGAHLAVKALAPILIPAKLSGLAAFFASGNIWFLLPLLLAPILRTLVTALSAIRSQEDAVPHTEALLVSWIPTFGSAAFPVQMFASRPRLSTFLIRDAASRIGCKIPIYGGPNSRTEIALIGWTDYVIQMLQIVLAFISKLGRLPAIRRSKSNDVPDVIRYRSEKDS